MATAQVEYFRDRSGKWYFRVIAENGEELVRSTDGYERIAGALNGFRALEHVLAAGINVEVHDAVEDGK